MLSSRFFCWKVFLTFLVVCSKKTKKKEKSQANIMHSFFYRQIVFKDLTYLYKRYLSRGFILNLEFFNPKFYHLTNHDCLKFL